MLDLNINEKLPKDVVNILHMLFDKGHMVNDFKLVGNHHGYSVTLHICDPHGVPPEWSPQHASPLKPKSPAAYKQVWRQPFSGDIS